ncbi:MAG: hypothetical protein IH849_05965 [Acidobacteria bacterium]|nr:hypothetical protein [Acidobacteriota bacterium]
MSSIAEEATLEALDFPLLVQALAGWAQTPMGKERLEKTEPLADPHEIEERHAEVAEFRAFMEGGAALSLAPARPLETALRGSSVAGTVLDFDDMVAVYRTAQVGQDVRRRLAGLDELPRLSAVGEAMPDLGPLVSQIEKVFDKDGEVRDSASPELAALRRKKRRVRAQLLASLEHMVKSDHLDGVLRDRLVTQRGGRYVVPVRAGRRAALPGVVHDSSSSGQTLYVEPLESVDQQNAVVEVELAERREVQRLLADLTGHVRAAAGALAATEQAIVALDARQAIARFAELMDAVRPTFTDGELSLRGARHPLMIPGVMAAGYQGELDAPAGANEPLGGVEGEEQVQPVPLDLDIDAATRALVITGPNTGGKTVVLKTVGLLTLMAQCGLPVPAAKARLSYRPRVHADIGDEQSIVASLSTFSAHLTRIKRFLDDSPPGSLVLLDELGTGTDPAEGAALGIAVLEHLAGLGATTIASTHHDALKAFAHASEDTVNAAMEFDSDTLRPTFKLRIGLPGRSNAFDIAETLGLDAALVERARGLIDIDAAELDSLIRSVEGEAEALASDREEVQEEQDRLAKAHGRYEALNRQLLELRESLAGDGRVAIDAAIERLRAEGDKMLATLSDELGETRKSRGAQDRRARWAARVGGADGAARRDLDAAVDASARAVKELVDSADMAAGVGAEAGAGAMGEALKTDDDDPTAPLERGQPVLVMPLNLRGQVARDWAGGTNAKARVEVNVHGKRLIVSRQQVRRLVP